MSKSLKNISIVATATVLSRLLGLGREIATAAVFGTSALNSAYVTAFTLPNLFRRLLGEGALTAAFVPALAHELEEKKREGAFRLLSKVSSWLAVVTCGLVALAMLFFSRVAWWSELMQGGGVSAETVERMVLGAHLAVILFPYMVFVCLAASFSAACQVLGRFTEPALSPVWLNLSVLSALGLGSWWAWGQPERMHLLCVGVLVGGCWQMAVPGWVLWREGWRPRLDLQRDPRVNGIARLMIPTLLGSAIYLINIALSRFIGLSLNEHATAVLNLANRVMELPIGVFTVAIATVVFPLISRHAAREEWDAMAADYHKGLRLVFVVNLPAAAGLALLSEPITRLLFERGAFQAADTELMTPILAVYALGLPFLSFTTLALRGFYALKDTATPVRAAGLSFVTNIVLSLVLMRWFSTVGLAMAGNLAVVVQAWYLQSRLGRKRAGLSLAPLRPNLGKMLVATLLMSAVVWGGEHGAAQLPWTAKARDLLVVAGLIPLAAGIYGGLVWLMRIEGREELELIIARLRGKKSAPGDAG